ncbi:MFS transporter [Kitasatospora albolonga]|uniref:MFS transporter n=1 Tax=Kitasatospora albolonga TaxID=68173 RepID=UPI0031E89C33
MSRRRRWVLISPEYTRLWFGQALSTVGDAVFSTSLVLWVATDLAAGRPWAPQAVSGVVLATSLSVLVVGPLAGVFVDRWDRRRTMLGTEVLRGGLAGVLTAVSFLPADALPIGLWLGLIYLTVASLNAVGQFFTPARMSVIADMVTGEGDRARAAGIAQATATTAWIIGPPLAAPLLFTVGIQWALLFNALSYVVSWFAVRSVRPDPSTEPARTRPKAERPSLVRDFVDGLQFYSGNRFLVALLLMSVIGQIGAGALSALNVFFVTDNLHVSAQLYGYLGTATGIGGILGALASGRVVERIGARRAAWAALLVSGILLVVYSRQSAFLPAMALLFVVALPLTVLNSALSPLLLDAAPAEFRARVMAVFYPATRLASMIGAVLAGWIAGTGLDGFRATLLGMRFGPIDTVLVAAGIVIVLAGVYARSALPVLDRGDGATAGPSPDRPPEAADAVEPTEAVEVAETAGVAETVQAVGAVEVGAEAEPRAGSGRRPAPEGRP